jgi:hypothetical protein
MVSDIQKPATLPSKSFNIKQDIKDENAWDT